MKYNIETGKLCISDKEFVALARRGISAVPVRDEDEPSLIMPGARALPPFDAHEKLPTLTYDFVAKGYSFELVARPQGTLGERIYVATYVDGNPEKPRTEIVKEIRGIGYVCAFAYAKIQGYSSVLLTVIYINDETGESVQKNERVTLAKLAEFFDKCCDAVAKYSAPEVERVTERLPSLLKLKFPYPEIREGQNEFMHAVYRTVLHGKRLVAGAPTGTGKTVSALYPTLRALGKGKCDKIFYFTPKTTIAEAARDCIHRMCQSGAKIRAVILASKERSCEMGSLCQRSRELCKMSTVNKIADAALELYSLGESVVTVNDARTVARRFSVCPHELMLTYSELCDVVILDFNYLFDPAVYIRRYFSEGGNYAFLFDEAHNLPDRAQTIFSEEISINEILSPTECDFIGALSPIRNAARECADKLTELLMPYLKDELYKGDGGEDVGATHVNHLPEGLYDALAELYTVTEDVYRLAYRQCDEEKAERLVFLRNYYYKIRKLIDTAEHFDSSYELFIFLDREGLRMKLFATDAGARIKERLSLGTSAVFFSATLTPLYYYRSVLGLDKSAELLEVDSPFDKGQLSVSIMDKISTRQSERLKTLPAVCRTIAAAVSARRGNYIVFSPSFAYSEALAKAFSAKYPKINVITQTRDMSAKERREFIEKFRDTDDKSYLIGFCVMGGIYSEGIDLAGEALIGAVIVGIGMPALSYERESMRAYYDEKYEEGMLFSYVYPGINRVLQAGGRVIRREDDRGIIVLIDDRFDDPVYKKSLPKLWHGVKFIADPKELRSELDEFWGNKKDGDA